jgi:hypothetical protein
MRCPYANCQKDYNDKWPKLYNDWVNPDDFGDSITERVFFNRVYITTRHCRFCNQLFHEIYVGHENFEDHTKGYAQIESTLELVGTYPVSKTRFEAKNVPKKVLDAFNEAERCRSVGSLTGTGGCLRKAVYELCDAKGVSGIDYREKITNLPVKEIYKELLKQIKWLGDNTTKPGEEKYTMAMLDVALEVLPVIIDDLYLKDEKEEGAARLLAKARSINKE